MHTNNFKTILKSTARVLAILSFATAAYGQQQINLTAAPTTTTMPDGTVVPMWGYSCGMLASGSTATCAALNAGSVTTAATSAAAAVGTWSPVVITVPYVATGTSLTINLTNNLSFTPTGATTANTIPTSIVIIGQVGGGLGSSRTTTLSPDHSTVQECPSWFIAANPPGTPCTAPTPNVTTNTPPLQGARVQSLAAEVPAVAATTTAACPAPPTAPSTAAVGTGCAALTWPALKPGTYLLESGTHPSIQVPMGLIGVLVVTAAPTSATSPGTAYPGAAATTTPPVTAAIPAVTYNAELPLEFSEIDPVQNAAVYAAVNTVGFSETKVWSGMLGQCGNALTTTGTPNTSGANAFNTCYPPAVNYTPFYFLINGVAFNKNSLTASLFTATAGAGVTTGIPTTGTVLARLVNAGLRMHVPSIVGSSTQGFSGAGTAATVGGFALIAEDGNPLPNVQVAGATTVPAAPRVQTDVFMAAGKVYDVMINVPTGGGVSAIAITAGGSGYLNGGSGPLVACSTTVTTGCVTISGGGGSGATATATVTAGVITAFSVTNPGNGYTAQPTVTPTDISGSPGTGFTVGTVSIMGIVPIYARDLGLSANSSTRDAGMIAYIGTNGTPSALLAGAGIGAGAGAGVFAAAAANPDTYNLWVAGQPFSVNDVSKGVIANDVNVYGVTLLAPPTNGTLSCNAQPQNTVNGSICKNGTFTYTPNATSTCTSTTTCDSFTYCANGTVSGTTCSSGLMATVTLGPSALAGSVPTAIPQTYYSKSATYLKMPAPTLLLGNSDPNKLVLSVVASTTPSLVIDANGGFALSAAGATSITCPTGAPAGAFCTSFSYTVKNSVGTTAIGTATVIFPTPSGLQVNVVDAAAYKTYGCNPLSVVTPTTGTPPGSITPGYITCGTTQIPFITDYRWIIEEDKTFWVDPNCTTNTSATTAGCPAVAPGPTGQTTIPTFGVNFHTSAMDYVAVGCTGPLSCEGGQTMLDSRATLACTGVGIPVASCTGGGTTVPNPTVGQHIPAVCDLGSGACRPDPNCTALPCTLSGGTTPTLPSAVHLDPTKRYYISILPGDAANPFPSNTSAPTNCFAPLNPDGTVNTSCGHTMGGAPVPPACNIFLNSTTPGVCTTSTVAPFGAVMVKVAPTPLPTAKLSVIVFEDDFPLNGEQDGGGGGGTIAPVEPGLGGFEIIAWDTFGGLGDFTGQDTHDAFNQPLSNALAGTIDPSTGLDACPISAQVTSSVLTGVSVKATLTVNSATFTPTSAVPADFAVGTSLSDTGGAIPSGTTVVSVASGVVTMSAAATLTAKADTIMAAGALGAQKGITGRIVTCPKYESDNVTLSPLAGQALIANLMPDKFSIQAYPGADRIARGEEWLQTNTLDGQHPHDAFLRVGEPGYFQEFGPSGYHVAIGFANPKIINARYADVCAGAYGSVGPCTNIIQGSVNVQRLSRTPDQRLYPSGSRDALAWTQCWVSLGDPDAEDFMFTKCDANGNFKFTNVPGGQWRLTIGDQWNDQIIDGLSTPANVGCTSTAANGNNNATTCPGGQTLTLNNIGVQQWQSNLYTRYFLDTNKNGIFDGNDIGVAQVYTAIRYRDGSNANRLLTDPNGVANFNETFPLFNWYVVEPDLGRYKRTGTHVVYDAGGPADGSTDCGTANGARACGKGATSDITTWPYAFLANTNEGIPLPADLSVPGAVYCSTADCAGQAASFAAGTAIPSSSSASTGRIDPPWVTQEGWSGMTSQGNWIEFGVAPYAPCPPACATVPNVGGAVTATRQVGENGGIHGHTAYAATRPFDDASQMIEQPWAPLVPNVTVNLYQEGFAADGVTPTLTLVDTTKSTSWDAWAQGFYPGSSAGSGTGAGAKPYMSCPGQGTSTGTNADLFFFSLYDQPNYLDWYNSLHTVAGGGAPTLHTLPYNSQYKCYDAMHIWNQIQPAPYDGYYQFPSITGINPTTGAALGTNCTICVNNPDSTDSYRYSKPGTNGLWNPAAGGVPMLPPGKYVVEVIMPPGYEVEKEEDKNLLIGDNFIAPVTVQFPGLGGSIFIVPDQASVASMYEPGQSGFNPTNYQNSTVGLGLNEELSGVPGFPGFQDPVWPCVGEMRVVPDYLSLFPQAKETAPFAGATRPLCDRKEVTLADQMNVSAKFYIYTSTHIASKFTGVITNDFTSEFDPFSPQFGEKFSPPNLPVSTRDYLGNEISRVYADHWGAYESLNFSSWEVNPPNITGYSPTMMVQCMNDAGPILDTRTTIPDPNNPGQSISNLPAAGGTYGQMITDPMYDPAYSQFCYEEPYMPGLTAYLDTPVVPTQAFVGAAYNNPDCAYPDATPAIKEVDGDGIGPYLSATGARTLTITALGNVQVNNSGYAGPSANAVPFNLKKVQRHYGFGAGKGTVMIGTYSVPATSITTWTDSSIVLTIPSGASIPPCGIQQQAQYGGSAAQCGQLVITTANTATSGPSNAKQSIDTVTVTIGGKAPTHVAATQTIQSVIDAAAPGDLIMVDPASHNEMLIMWKPVRLQGVGAASSIINANANPAGTLLDPWRRNINCLFGLTLSGVPMAGLGTGSTPPAYDSTGKYTCSSSAVGGSVVGPNGNTWQYFTTPNTQGVPQVDRIPLEAVVGWDATLNGNLAEQLQEPSLMGAYEGAGITVLAKGVWTSAGENIWAGVAGESSFPADALLLQDVAQNANDAGGQVGPQYSYCFTPGTGTTTELNPNPYPSNFECNPSSIDGLTVTNSSQGGGGIFIHGWGHNLQIANNRVYNNAGTLSGGISVGQGEFPTSITVAANTAGVGAAIGESVIDLPSCAFTSVIGVQLPYCLDVNVNIQNNFIVDNAALGDELFSGTLSGGGGATFCTGADYYKFNYNWVCGNQSSGEGGGVTHLGFIYDGDIEHNAIVLNQSINPTIPTNGGGISIQGTPDTDPTCGVAVADVDCPPGLSDGTGPNLKINANLIQANSADSGAGGGIRLNQVSGTDVSRFPTGCVKQGAATLLPLPSGGCGSTTATSGTVAASTYWNGVAITNNIIVNNMAGWDGAGISLQDALNVSIVNNTIAHNDSLADSGVLTSSIGTPQASAPAGNCTLPGGTGPQTASCPQPAGVSSTLNTKLLTDTFAGLTITCPPGQSPATGPSACQNISNPIFGNNLLWENRSFQIGVAGLGSGNLNQQNLVTLYNASFTGGVASAAPAQTVAGQCPSSASYWDIGVRGDTGPDNHGSGARLNPTYSVLTSLGTSYSGGHNSAAPPPVISEYCNGSRVPPECSVANGCGGPSGFGVPPGIADATTPNPVFSLTPSATVDEGNNWINVSWGPLAVTNPAVLGPPNPGASGGDYGGGPLLANYALSEPIDSIPTTVAHPSTDFFGNARPDALQPGGFDPGAVEAQASTATGSTLTQIVPSAGARGTTVAVTIYGTDLSEASAVTAGGGVTATLTSTSTSELTANFVIAPTAGLSTRNVIVTTPGGPVSGVTFTVQGPTLTSISPTSGVRGTTVPVTITGTDLTGATAVTVSGTGVTATITGTPTATTVTANLTIAASAAANARNITVTTPAGTTAALVGAFTVQGPTLTSISPTSGVRGTTFPVTITGTNLTGATAVTVSGAGVTATITGTPTATTVTANVTVAPGAGLTARNITVTTPIGTTAPLVGAFTVQGATLAISAPAPALTTTPANTTTKTGTITVTNTAAGATAGPFTLTAAPTITRTAGAGTFSITGGTCASGSIVNPGGSCTVNVQYVPGGTPPTATSTAHITLTGTGIAAGTINSSNFNGN